jgi:drug/metabolite transporter (DMT)-like permease
MWALFALGSAAFEGGAMIVEKKTLIKEHAMEFTASMALFAMLFTTPLWFFAHADLLSIAAIGWIFLASISSALTLFFFAKALRHLALAYTTPFLAFGPLLIVALAAVFFSERLLWYQWTGILVMLFGAYLLHAHSHHKVTEPIKHMFKIAHMRFIWLGMLFYAMTGLLDKKIVGGSELHVPVLPYIVLLFFFMAVIMIIMMLLFHDGFRGIGNGMKNNTKWLSIVALLTIGFKVLVIYAISLPGVLLSLVIPIKELSALFSNLFSGELFHEAHLLKKTIASVLLICGAVILLL